MKKWFYKNYRAIIISAFLIPIITVAIVSISHVTVWYGISNPMTWAAYLSVGVEIAALSALAAISAKMGSKVYFPFGIVTLIQFIGNIYFAYQFIETDSETFKDWVELVSPLLEYIGIEPTDFAGHKRFLSLFGGGMLPVISLSFLHMLVKFTQENEGDITNEKNEEPKQVVDASDLMGELTRVRLSDEDLKKLEDILTNPPPPNEKLKQAAKEYKERVNDQITDSVTTKKKREEILGELMKEDQEFGLYDLPPDNTTVNDNPVVPALSNEEVYKMNLDEWERKLDDDEKISNNQEDWESYNKLMDLQEEKKDNTPPLVEEIKKEIEQEPKILPTGDSVEKKKI